jgi:hypothetical protein
MYFLASKFERLYEYSLQLEWLVVLVLISYTFWTFWWHFNKWYGKFICTISFIKFAWLSSPFQSSQ